MLIPHQPRLVPGTDLHLFAHLCGFTSEAVRSAIILGLVQPHGHKIFEIDINSQTLRFKPFGRYQIGISFRLGDE